MSDDTDIRGVLLKRFLDSESHDHPFADYDVVERAEGFFKKSEEEEQERAAGFSEWMRDIVRQPLPEIDCEDDIEAAHVSIENEPNDAGGSAELTAELDHLVSEADLDALETRDRTAEETEDAE